MVEEITQDLYRVAVPLTFNPLGSVNIYVVIAADRVYLIDSGWNTEEAYAVLLHGLRDLGRTVTDIQEIVTTHLHPDHYGLAEQLAREAGARLFIHHREAALMEEASDPRAVRLERMRGWLASNGVPRDEREVIAEESVVDFATAVPVDHSNLPEGTVLNWGTYRFEVMWTPGHSAGLICLYDRQFRVLVSSDHVLERISPHIGKRSHNESDPLGDYLESLKTVVALPVDTVLPGHGPPFHDLSLRVEEIVTHHDRRLRETLDALRNAGERSAYQVASHIHWRGAENGWAKLHPFHKRMALDETVAHLDHLKSLGRVWSRQENGLQLYSQS